MENKYNVLNCIRGVIVSYKLLFHEILNSPSYNFISSLLAIGFRAQIYFYSNEF